MLLQTMTEAVY